MRIGDHTNDSLVLDVQALMDISTVDAAQNLTLEIVNQLVYDNDVQDTEHADLLKLTSSDTAFRLLNPGTSEAQFSPATATFSFNNELYADFDFAGFSNFQSG